MGADVQDNEYDLETLQLLPVWFDWHDFDIVPWRRADEPDSVIPYYKNALRQIDRMYNQAENNKNSGRGADRWIAEELKRQGKAPRKRR